MQTYGERDKQIWRNGEISGRERERDRERPTEEVLRAEPTMPDVTVAAGKEPCES